MNTKKLLEIVRKSHPEYLDEEIRIIAVLHISKEEWRGNYITYMVDETGDPRFYCGICEQEHNHTYMNSTWTRNDDQHYTKLIRKITISELLKCIKEEKK